MESRLEKSTVTGERLVYHYTSAAGAFGIISSGKIWCPSVYYMNDRQEGIYARSVAHQCANILLKASAPEVRTAFTVELQRQLERTDDAGAFAVCFSEAGDLLSQWRGYGGNGGFSLGFGIEALSQAASRIGMQVKKVLYKNDEQIVALLPIVKSFMSSFDFSILGNREKIGDIFLPLARAIAAESAWMKDAAFSEEREWRLCALPYSNDNAEVSYILRSGLIVPTVVFDLYVGQKSIGKRELRDHCLRNYFVGPGSDRHQQLFAISGLLRKMNWYTEGGGTSRAPLK